MKPYDKKFVLDQMKKYNELLNNDNCGNCKIIKNISDELFLGYMYENKEKYNVPAIKLLEGDKNLMEITPREIEGSYESIEFAYGIVGIVGLGLGYVAQEIAKKSNVEQVIVYEINKEVIDLYNRNFKSNSKIKIIHGDAFKAKREKFNFFYVDIYEYELTLKVVEDYKAFNQIHEIEEYSFWGLEHFLLSCKYEDIVWVYIPEKWIAMSKKIYEALNSSGYIEKYKPLEEDKVREILLEFKKIFNS